jgi:hypothetical protein
MSYSELALLFDTQDLTNVKDQLAKSFDEHSVIGSMKQIPAIILVRKQVWLALEMELNKLIKTKGASKHSGYDIAKAFGPGISRPDSSNDGYDALIYRGRPIVAMPAEHNVISDRLGANS